MMCSVAPLPPLLPCAFAAGLRRLAAGWPLACPASLGVVASWEAAPVASDCASAVLPELFPRHSLAASFSLDASVGDGKQSKIILVCLDKLLFISYSCPLLKPEDFLKPMLWEGAEEIECLPQKVRGEGGNEAPDTAPMLRLDYMIMAVRGSCVWIFSRV